MPWPFSKKAAPIATPAPVQQQPSSSSVATAVSPITQMQQTAGNQAVNAQLGAAQPKSPKESRKDELNADRDLQAPNEAKKLFDGLIAQSKVNLHSYLNTDKQTATLRTSLQVHAKEAVEANIDQKAGLMDHEKADAKKYAEGHVGDKGIVSATLKKYADNTVDANLPSTEKAKLQTKFVEGYNKTEANPSTTLAKQTNAARTQALKEATQEANRLSVTSILQMKKEATDEIKTSSDFLNSTVDVGTLGENEADKRHQLEGDLVQATVIDTVFTNKLFEPIKQAVVMKLGVGRGAWRRSKELNAFREKMKDAARNQANSDIDASLDTNALTSSKTALDKKFTGMMAKKEAHKTSKASVDKTMESTADKIVKRVLPDEATKKELKLAAQTSAYQIARADGAVKVKVNEAALLGAEKKAIEIMKVKQTTAVNEVRLITKGDKKTGAKADSTKQTELAAETKQKVIDDEIANKAIKKTVEAPTFNSGLSKIGFLLDLSVPNTGDSSSFSIDLKIPVHASGVYVLFGLAGSAEREENELTMSAELTFGAGFQTFGFDANFRAGFFIESQGNNATSVMNLASYGMYRQMRVISNKAADYFWGQGGKSGMEEVEEAELWAAMIEEKELQNDDNRVDVGAVLQLQAEANAGVAELAGSISQKRLGRFNKESLNRVTQGKFGGATDLAQLKKKATDLDKQKGDRVRTLEVESEVAVELGGNKVSFGLEGSGTTINKMLRSFEVKGSGSIPFQFGEDSAEWAKLAAKVATPVGGAVKNLYGIITGKMKKDPALAAKATSSALDIGTDLIFVIPQFEEVGISLAKKIQGDETVNDTIRGWLTGDSSASAIEQGDKIALASSLDLSISFSKNWNAANVSNGWEIALEVSQTKSFEVDAGIVSVAVERSKRLGKLEL